MSVKELAQNIAETVDKKGAAYGNAIDFVEKTLTELYPNGIPVAAYSHALITIRVLDKLKRLSTDPNAFGESPWEDIVGYALRGAEKTRSKEREEVLNHDFQVGPLYTGLDLLGVNSVVRGNPDLAPKSGFALALMQEQVVQEHAAHVSAHNEFFDSFIFATWQDQITDEDVYMAVDVLVELLQEGSTYDFGLFVEICQTLHDLGWSDDDIIEASNLTVPVLV